MTIGQSPIDYVDGGARRHAIEHGECSTCGGEAKQFRDQKSQNEFKQSGMCQGCQDSFFTQTSSDFEFHGIATTVTIAVDLRRDGSATIEAFAFDADTGDVSDIGLWTVDAETRKAIAPMVVDKVKAWAVEHKVLLDDGVTDSEVVFRDFRVFLRGTQEAVK